MSVIYQPSHVGLSRNYDRKGYVFDPPPPPGMVKKSTMYIIVALSVMVTAMMFASTTTVVYLIARGRDNAGYRPDHGTGTAAGHAGDVTEVLGSTSRHTEKPVWTTVRNVPTQSSPAGVSNYTRVPTTGHPTTVAKQTSKSAAYTTMKLTTTVRPPTESVTTFTRWGKAECTSNSELLYSGYTAGSRYNYHGGSSTVLCLPKVPQYKSFYAGGSGSYVYGSEYNSRDTQLQAIFGKQLNEQDIPCAVCEAKGRGATMMIPARTECYNKWNKEYSGYLMTSHESHNKSMDIVCIDENPGFVTNQAANSNGALFWFVEVNGQLVDNPSYMKGAELTCVVCTK